MDFEEYLREDEAKFSNFDEYLRVSEPHTRERACAWKAAIGLQAVDGLHVSEYLKETALRHIEGEISIDDARDLVRGYYQTRTARLPDDSEAQEADKVAVNITKLLSEKSFSFSVPGFVATHRRIFEGVFDHAGTLREFDITKKEWVLRGDTVLYVSCEELVRTLEYDIVQERKFSYAGLNMNETILHLAKFVSGLWQIHPFCEGNTRTTAIFIIKYLRSIGFEADNTLFERHSWYFRNALVRANYRNVKKGITPNFEFLIRFFRNLLVGEKNELRNRHLLINAPVEWGTPITSPASPATSSPSTCPTSFESSPTSCAVTPPATSPVSSKSAPASSSAAWEELSENVRRFVLATGTNALSVKEAMAAVGLKDRKNFIEYTLSPALKSGVAVPLYPDKPHHPRQKYRLTVKGLALFNENKTSEN